MYSLLIEGNLIGDFHDWPRAWDRGEESDVQAEKPKVRVASPAVHVDAKSLLSRYQSGEHEAVWRDLVSLGPEVRKKGYSKAAREVAFETIRRANYNLVRLTDKLKELDYEFLHGDGFDELPSDEDLAALKGCDRARLYLPLSVRTFIDVIGAVSLNGVHPILSPENSGIDTDAFEMDGAYGLDGALEEWKETPKEEREEAEVRFVVGPDASGKASMLEDGLPDSSYEILLPDASADALLIGEPGKRTFVEYLRWSFQWGGFPGWANYEKRPESELAFLREGLMPL